LRQFLQPPCQLREGGNRLRGLGGLMAGSRFGRRALRLQGGHLPLSIHTRAPDITRV
jgi:hypothetical protein